MTEYTISSAVSRRDIDLLLERIIVKPGPRHPAMSYEDGIRVALEWIIGDLEGDNPIEDMP